MGANHVELENFITPKAVEWAYGRCVEAHRRRQQSFADIGWRAALARDERLLKTLEKCAEVLHATAESQLGETRRSSVNTDQHYMSAEPTELGMVRAAFETVDAGKPHEAYQWIYGMAALLCGYNT
jgi:hypothetical protein